MTGLHPGSTVAHYLIKEPLGSGGMGEVYKAVDTRLGRIVALKTLASESAGDEVARERLLREARAASALSHPGICTTFEVGEDEGILYLTMQYIEGRSLKQLLESGPLPLERTLAYALHIADALEEAHRHGIVHRDLKPSNIIINERGLPLILDFGLAKQLRTEGADAEDSPTLQQLTRGTSILGTVQYMSPEQIRGRAADQRSDIFSFGIVLYEMLGGVRPFNVSGQIEAMHAILHDQPRALVELRPEIDSQLEGIVARALKKEPLDRYQSIRELKEDLAKYVWQSPFRVSGVTPSIPFSRSAGVSSPSAIPSSLRISRSAIVLSVAIAAILVLSWIAFRKVLHAPPHANEIVTQREVFSWKSEPGELLDFPKFSPDSKLIVFSSSKGGHQKIWIKQLVQGEPVQITKGESTDWSPVWSPDGQQIAFASNRGGEEGIWSVPAFGDQPEQLCAIKVGRPVLSRWSKQGKRIFFEAASNIFALDPSTKEVKQLTHFDPYDVRPRDPSIAPEETRVAFCQKEEGGAEEVWVLNLKGGTAAQLTRDGAEARTPVWHPDGKRIFYNSNRSGSYQIWMTYLDGRPAVQVTVGAGESSLSDVSPDGRKILYSFVKEEAGLWFTHLSTGRETRLTSNIDSALWPDVSPDGKSIVFQSAREIYFGSSIFHSRILEKTTSPESSEMVMAADGFCPVWSPLPGVLTFLRLSNNALNLWTVRADGSHEKQITSTGVLFGGLTLFPCNKIVTRDFSWSPDGTRIAYCSKESGQPNIWVTTPDGATRYQASANAERSTFVQCPLWSPREEQIAYLTILGGPAGAQQRRWQLSIASQGTRTTLYESRARLRLLGWSANGDEILLAQAGGEQGDMARPEEIRLLWVPLSGAEARRLTNLKGSYFTNILLSQRGQRILFVSRKDGHDNIWSVSARGGVPVKITANTEPRIYFSSLVCSPDASTVYYGKQSEWIRFSLIENFGL